MKKDNTPTAGPQNPAVLESKIGRGKHPNSRKKPGEELVRVKARIYARQYPATNEEIRAALDFYRARPE